MLRQTTRRLSRGAIAGAHMNPIAFFLRKQLTRVYLVERKLVAVARMAGQLFGMTSAVDISRLYNPVISGKAAEAGKRAYVGVARAVYEHLRSEQCRTRLCRYDDTVY